MKTLKLLAILGLLTAPPLAWVRAPYVAMKQLSTAIQQKDGESLLQVVDVGLVRDGLLEQVNALFTPDDPKRVAVHSMIDEALRPDAVKSIAQSGMLVDLLRPFSESSKTDKAQHDWHIAWVGCNQVNAVGIEASPKNDSKPLTLTFRRVHGLSWKLVRVDFTSEAPLK